MTILASETKNTSFQLIFSVQNGSFKFECKGGENVSLNDIGLAIHALTEGQLMSDILEAVKQWGGQEKIASIAQFLHNINNIVDEDNRYCIHPLEVFKMNSQPIGPNAPLE